MHMLDMGAVLVPETSRGGVDAEDSDGADEVSQHEFSDRSTMSDIVRCMYGKEIGSAQLERSDCCTKKWPVQRKRQALSGKRTAAVSPPDNRLETFLGTAERFLTSPLPARSMFFFPFSRLARALAGL